MSSSPDANPPLRKSLTKSAANPLSNAPRSPVSNQAVIKNANEILSPRPLSNGSQRISYYLPSVKEKAAFITLKMPSKKRELFSFPAMSENALARWRQLRPDLFRRKSDATATVSTGLMTDKVNDNQDADNDKAQSAMKRPNPLRLRTTTKKVAIECEDPANASEPPKLQISDPIHHPSFPLPAPVAAARPISAGPANVVNLRRDQDERIARLQQTVFPPLPRATSFDEEEGLNMNEMRFRRMERTIMEQELKIRGQYARIIRLEAWVKRGL